MPYPIRPPDPISQSNPLICSIPPFGPTATGIELDVPALAELVAPLNIIDGLGDENQALLSYRIQSGLLQIFDPTTAFDAPTRAAMRASLATEIYGAATATAEPALMVVGNWMPGYAEEASWCVFCTADVGDGAEAVACTGSFNSSSAFFAWQVQVFAQAWRDHEIAGLIPAGSPWRIRATGPANPPWGFLEGYGFDPVDDQEAAQTAAASMLEQIQGWMASAALIVSDPCE